MIATLCEMPDRELVAAVRAGDDSAFEELYRRYQPRIAAYVRRMLHDESRAEDLAQDSFFSALRRLRATDAEITFKPWIFEIARNAAIDQWRRNSRAEEVSVDQEERLRPADRVRLVGSAAPDTAMIDKERLVHLQGAFDELSDVHTRVLVMRELEGMSYREIADRLQLSRSSVESALFRARRRLESEYADISEGRRCESMRAVMGRLAEGLSDRRDEARLARHARRCHACRRGARELGLEPLAPARSLRDRVAALLPLSFLPRRGDGGLLGGLFGLGPAGAQAGPALAERVAALAAAAAIAGAGGAALGGAELIGGADDESARPAPVERRDATPSRPQRDLAPSSAGRSRTEPARRPGDSPARRRKGEPGARAERGTGPGGAAETPTGSRPGAGSSEPPAAPGGVEVPRLPAAPELPPNAPAGPPAGGPRLPAVPNVPLPEVPSPPPVRLPPVTVPPVEPPAGLPLDTGPATDTLEQVLPG